MKRYKAINFEYDDADGTGTALDIIEHPEGEWVKYDDIKHLLKNTSLVLKLKKLDCGSSACRFAQDKSGQRTNSGCTCLQGIPDSVRIEIEKIFINYKMNGFE